MFQVPKIDSMHRVALSKQEDGIDKLFLKQWVMSNLRHKNNKMQ